MGPINPGGAATVAELSARVHLPADARRPKRRCARRRFSRRWRAAPIAVRSTDADMKVLLDFYNEGRAAGTFDAGIELALQRILVSPSFLFRTSSIAAAPARGGAARASGFSRTSRAIASATQLASRLSFFLWSSIPDEELLELAERGQAARARGPRAAGAADARRSALARRSSRTSRGSGCICATLPASCPIRFCSRTSTTRCARAFRRETELFFDSIVREDRPALDLLRADYTFVNERLARHYGIPNVKGITSAA